VIVHSRISEGEKARIQYVEGVVIRKSGNGITKTFTLRKMSDGIGVEIIYPLNSESIANIEIVNHGDVRRARLFYLRGLTGKAARLKSKDGVGTDEAATAKKAAKAAAK
jgi:large subunit ribosomal protein L19